jgi:hypothetical protein
MAIKRLDGQDVGRRGVKTYHWSAITGGTFSDLAQANEGRVALLIVNVSDTAICALRMKPDEGNRGFTAGFGAYLWPHGTFQIDQNFPWTGGVELAAISGTVTVHVTELEDGGG